MALCDNNIHLRRIERSIIRHYTTKQNNGKARLVLDSKIFNTLADLSTLEHNTKPVGL